MSQRYKEAPELPPLLDTCYDLEGYKFVSLPTIVLNFERANVTLDPSGIVWRETDSQVCLAFAENTGQENDLIIIGSTQQSKLNILYDVNLKLVGFGQGSCGIWRTTIILGSLGTFSLLNKCMFSATSGLVVED